MTVRHRMSAGTRDRGSWLVLFALVIGVLLPAASVIWFMSEAAANQADAARQRLSDARRGQLQLLRDRVNTDWALRVGRLSAIQPAGAAAFYRAATSGDADAVIFLDRRQQPVYPRLVATAGTADAVESSGEWRLAMELEAAGAYVAAAKVYAAVAAHQRPPDRVARAAQAHIRMLLRAGDSNGALKAIDRFFLTSPSQPGRDRYGRLIAADAQLMALRLLSPTDTRFAGVTERLATLVNDYDVAPIPSSQRLFVMNELRERTGSGIELPTYEAEQLAVRFLEADGEVPAGPTLEATRLPHVWKLAVGSHAIALFRTETVAALARALLTDDDTPQAASLSLVPPGSDMTAETVAAGSLLPGWLIQMAPSVSERQEQTTGMATYVWAGSFSVAGLAIGGLLLWQAFRRQMQLNRLKTDLVAAVSHELRTPLASIQVLVDLLLENPTVDRQKAREYLTMIAGENARLSRLIEHFLTFSRVERNGHGLVFRDVTPAALVMGLMKPPAADRFPGLRLEVAPDLPPLYGDEDALTTVLLNLVENAYKYTGADKRIGLRLRQQAEHVIVEVHDNGIGIERRNQKRIFRPFYQVDQRLARERGGCGLGLSIVDYVVRAHGGAVTVESTPGVGSMFRITLPSRLSKGATAA